MAAEIKVGVGADVSDLQDGMKKAGTSVAQFSSSLGDLEKQLKRSKEALKEATDPESIIKINKAIAVTESRIGVIKKLSDTAVTSNKAIGVSFQGTARVLQDAAFGPGAIANNLEGLSNDFKQLSAQAKESGQSIGKTLVQSLMGGGGLNLALGGLTLGLSLASFGMQAWTRIFGENSKVVKKAKDDTDDYVKSLDSVKQASLKGAQNAQKELTDVQLLFGAYQNANLPLKERKEAYAELQKQYPAYFGNLKFEKEAGEKVTSAYNALTQSILATAQARAAADLIAQKSSEQLVNLQKITDLETGRLDLINQVLTARKQLETLNKAPATQRATEAFSEQAARLARKVLDLEDQQGQKADEITAIKQANNKLDEEKLKLVQFTNTQLAKGATLTGDIGKETKKEIEKITLTNLPKIQTLGSDIADAIVRGLNSNEKKVGDAFTNLLKVNPTLFGQAIGDLTKKGNLGDTLDFLAPKTPTLDTSTIDKVNEKLNLIRGIYPKAVAELNAQNEILKQGFESAFEGIGEALGNAFASGENPLKALGASILSAMGDVLVQFGKLTIAAGIASTALATALSNPFNPGSGVAAIAAGVALVAIGSAVKSFAGGLAKGGSSGGSARSGGSFSPSVPSGFSPSAPGGQAATPRSDVITVQGILKGQDILLSSQRTQALNFRTGGAI